MPVDCARYIATTILCLCAPAPPRTRAEYRAQFAASAPDVATQVRGWTPHGMANLLSQWIALG